MAGDGVAEESSWTKRLLSPWSIAAALLAAFFLYQGWDAWRDRALYDALNNHAAFGAPAFPLEFSRTIQYDPLSFVGRGARAGFWQWTPQGLVLTDRGREYFREEGGKFISAAPAGRREVTRIRWREAQGVRQQLEFFYAWTELSPVTVALLYPSPKPEQEFLGNAALIREGSGWRVESVSTRDFDEPLARLQKIASGVME